MLNYPRAPSKLATRISLGLAALLTVIGCAVIIRVRQVSVTVHRPHERSLVTLADSAELPREMNGRTPLIVPRPKSLIADGSGCSIDSSWVIFTPPNPSQEDLEATQAIRDRLHECIGSIPAVRALPNSGTVQRGIVVGVPDRSSSIAAYVSDDRSAPPATPEGYSIRVSAERVIVAGRDSAGVLNGAESLCQLIQRDTVTTARIPGVRIDDYPTLGWRGVHIFVGEAALPFHERLIELVLARCHFNHIVLQCEQAKWDMTKDVAPAWGMSKTDLETEVAFARAHGLDPIPLVESAAHMEWLLQSPKYASFAEDPKVPFAIRPDDPASLALLFPLYDEVLNTFGSKEIFIGGDELLLRGRYPCASKSRFATVDSAFAAHISALHAHLAAEGVRTYLWGDMLLGPGEGGQEASEPTTAQAVNVRRLLPHDMTIFDWHYSVAENYPSVGILRNAGFPVHCCDMARSTQHCGVRQASNCRWGFRLAADNLVRLQFECGELEVGPRSVRRNDRRSRRGLERRKYRRKFTGIRSGSRIPLALRTVTE